MREDPLGTEWKEQCVRQKEQSVRRFRGKNELSSLKDPKEGGQGVEQSD